MNLKRQNVCDQNDAATSKKYISLSAPQGRVYTHSSSGTVSATLLIHKKICFFKKKKKFLQTCINLQSYNARFFLHFLFLCQTKYWLCYNALREYVTKIIHSTRSVQNIPNLSNEAFVFTCIQRCTHGNGDQGSSGIAVEWIILLPVQHGNIKLIFYFKQWHLLDHFN